MQQQFATHPQETRLDLLFVLAGLESRKSFGLELFRLGHATRVLLSVGRFEIRKFRLLNPPVPVDLLERTAPIPPPLRHFFVSFEYGHVSVERIPQGPLGTFSEIRALSAWLKSRPHIASVVVISSAYHLPRLRLCCWAMLPTSVRVKFLPSPCKTSAGAPACSFWTWSNLTLVLSEFVKIPLYLFVILPGAGRKLRRITGDPNF